MLVKKQVSFEMDGPTDEKGKRYFNPWEVLGRQAQDQQANRPPCTEVDPYLNSKPSSITVADPPPEFTVVTSNHKSPINAFSGRQVNSAHRSDLQSQLSNMRVRRGTRCIADSQEAAPFEEMPTDLKMRKQVSVREEATPIMTQNKFSNSYGFNFN